MSDNQLNTSPPRIMHIDLNSCFASVAQQLNPLLRGKVLVVVSAMRENGVILSPSIEAKAYGIKTGMRVFEARRIYSRLIMREPEVSAVRDVHDKFKKIFVDYTPIVLPRSIDEAILDFTGEGLHELDLVLVAREIKQRMKNEIGCYIRCSVGIGTNRFWAKTGASLKKPDGLEVVCADNIEAVYKRLKLVDLYGINVRYEARLNAAGIFTPLEFLNASELKLKKEVFKSIAGSWWYARLRGYEVDSAEWERRSFGNQYALERPTNKKSELLKILMKLCEKTGRRLRRSQMVARGIHLAVLYEGNSSVALAKEGFHQGKTQPGNMLTTVELYKAAEQLFIDNYNGKIVKKISITCFSLEQANTIFQEFLFEDTALKVRSKMRAATKALDAVNDRYGEFTVFSARMLEAANLIPDRIAFGNVRE